jgi:putative peptidoglycan lipid II flippase
VESQNPEVKTTQTKTAARSTVTMMIGTLASRFTGFLRQSLLTQLFSETINDAFNVAQKMPYLLRELLAEGALTGSFVPNYKSLSKEEARKLSSAFLGFLIALNSALLILVYFLTPWLVDMLLAEKSNIDRALVEKLLPLTFPVLTMVSLSAWAMGILNAEEKFFAPAWAPAALNVTTIILMILFPQSAVMLSWGLVIGGLIQFVVQIPSLLKGGYVGSFRGLWHPKIGGVLYLMVPSIFSTSGRQILNFVTTNLLSRLPVGSATSFANADLFLSLALGLFAVSPTTVYYTRLSDNAVNNPEKFTDTLQSGLKFITFMAVPGGLFLSVFAQPIIQVVFNWLSLFGRAGASPDILNYSSLLLGPLGLAVFPISLLSLTGRTFFIRGKVVYSILFSLVFIVFHGVLYYTLSRLMGIAGMSWATVIMTWTQLFALLFIVSRVEKFSLKGVIHYALRAWAAGLMAIAIAGLVLFLPGMSWWIYLAKVGLGLMIFIGLYLTFAQAFKLPEVHQLLWRFKR